MAYRLRGIVKLKKSKNPRKTRIGQNPATQPPIHFFLGGGGECTTTKNNTKNNKKNIFKEKLNLRKQYDHDKTERS